MTNGSNLTLMMLHFLCLKDIKKERTHSPLVIPHFQNKQCILTELNQRKFGRKAKENIPVIGFQVLIT